MTTIVDYELGKNKLRKRLLCLKERQEEQLERIVSLIDQREECCILANDSITLESEQVTESGEVIVMS